MDPRHGVQTVLLGKHMDTEIARATWKIPAFICAMAFAEIGMRKYYV